MSTTRLSKKEYFLAILELVAARSTCARRRVGAIITDRDGHILSTGYNGVPRSVEHCIDVPCAGAADLAGNTSRCMAVHAEQNAILQCYSLDRAHTLYVSCVPCFVCSKMIANTEIKEIICIEDYADRSGLIVLLDQGITVEVKGNLVV